MSDSAPLPTDRAVSARDLALLAAIPAREFALLAAITALALALRLALVAVTPGLELYGDQAVYAAEAAQILEGERTDAYRGPGYPAFVAAWQWLLGRGDVAPRIGNALAGALAIPLFWALLRTLFSPRVAWIGAGLLALYPRAVFMPAYLFAENSYLPLLLLGIWMTIRAAAGGARAACVVAGIAFGLGALTREMLLSFVPVAAAVVALLSPLATRERVVRAGLLVGVTAAVVLPWTIRNHRVHQQWIPIGYSDGIPWFEGNYVAESQMAVFRKRVALSNQYLEEAARAGIDGADRRNAFMNERIKQDAWRAIRERQPAWIFEKIATNVPRILRPNVRNEVLIGKWPMPPERQGRLSRVLLFGAFLPAHLLLLSLGPLGLAHWRLATPAVLPLLYLGFSFAVHVAANAAHFRFEYPYEWVLLAGAALTLDRGLPRSTLRRVVAVTLAAIALGSQLAIPGVWRSGFG